MRNAFYILFMSLLVSFVACDDDFDNYSTSSQHVLSFSVDTLRFDTILSTINTPRYGFTIYNKNKKNLLISSIQLNDNSNTFKINVDGMAGSSFQDVEIRANDSLFVFVDARPGESGKDYPVKIIEQVEFLTNKISQKVHLEAYTQDVVIWNGKIIDEDCVLENNKPYLILDSLFIKENTTVDILEGTTFYMHANANIIVEGTLRMKGTLENPITIRGDRTDWFFDNVPYDRIPGQWGGITFRSTSFNNIIEYAYIRNGMYGLIFEESDLSQSKMRMKNMVLTNFKGKLLHSVNCDISAENCEFSNSKDALAHLIGGSYSFIHCTMANYYYSNTTYGWGNSNNETLVLENKYHPKSGDPVIYPIINAEFKNTLIYGSKSSTSGIRLNADEGSVLNHRFVNCIIPNKGENDDDFVNCIFAKDPKLLKTDPRDRDDDRYNDYRYDFRLTDESPARNVADVVTAQLLPLDINGSSRFLDDGPDIGGYEYIDTEE